MRNSGMRARRRTVILGGACCAAALALAACGSSSSSGSASGAVTHITLGVAAGNGPGNADLALQLGYFKAAGLDVTIKPLNGGGAEAVAGLEGGSLSIVESNTVSVIQSAEQGIDTPCFTGGVDFRQNEGTTFESIKSITKPSQLAGKSIGVISTNSGNTLMIDAYLAAHGVNYNSVHYVATGVTDTLAALQNGSIQAGETVSPYSVQFLSEGGNLLVEDFGPIVATPLFACWTAEKSWLSAHTAAAKAFIQALDKADTYYYAHPQAASADIGKVNGLPASANLPDVAFTFTTAITGAQVQRWITLGKKYGLLTGNVKLSAVYDPISS